MKINGVRWKREIAYLLVPSSHINRQLLAWYALLGFIFGELKVEYPKQDQIWWAHYYEERYR